MSKSIARIPASQAHAIAGRVISLLKPFCERIEIAGSLRRGKPDVGDLEIVCIPTVELDLFSGEVRTAARIEAALRTVPTWTILKNGSHFKQIDLGPCNLDLFITTPPQWGVIFLLRTGDAEFSRKMVTPKQQGGFMPGYLKVHAGRVWNGPDALDTPEETDVFAAYGKPFVKPDDRNW